LTSGVAVIAIELTITNEAVIKAQPEVTGNDHCRKTQKKRENKKSGEIAGI
jgi:hypothetical protein